MSKYIPISKAQEARANGVNLEALLRSKGEHLKRSGSEWLWLRHKGVTVRGNQWYSHYDQHGGCAIDFMRRFYGMSYPEAVLYLLGSELPTVPPEGQCTGRKEKTFKLPEAHRNMRRAYAYLTKTRCIDREVVAHFASRGLIYESAKHHNAVFTGRDEHGVPRHAHKLGTCSRGGGFRANAEGSDPRYSFHHVGTSDTIHVFESPVDLLSYITLYPQNWTKDSYVALCGVAEHAMLWMLEQNPHITRIALHLDNDPAGAAADQRLIKTLQELGDMDTRIEKSRLKDFNEDLIAAKGAVTCQQV